MIFTIGAWVATALLAAAALLGLLRAFTATDQATRAVVGDLVFFACVGILIIQGELTRSRVSVDAMLISAILGVVATVALARILTRGRR